MQVTNNLLQEIVESECKLGSLYVTPGLIFKADLLSLTRERKVYADILFLQCRASISESAIQKRSRVHVQPAARLAKIGYPKSSIRYQMSSQFSFILISIEHNHSMIYKLEADDSIFPTCEEY